MIILTEKAIEKIKDIAKGEGYEPSVRVKIVGGGCAGFTQDMYFDTDISDMDEIIESNGIKVIVDPVSFQYLEGSTIDYIDSAYSAGFKFLNPNVKGSCGCGNSVSY